MGTRPARAARFVAVMLGILAVILIADALTIGLGPNWPVVAAAYVAMTLLFVAAAWKGWPRA